MRMIWFLLYNILIVPILVFATPVVGLFHHKIRLGLAGRRQSLAAIKVFGIERRPEDKLILFHCASLGEYEQIKPVLQLLSQQYPELKKVISFFSPSGYEHMGENSNVDLKVYLPADSPRQVALFLNSLQLDAFVISKHDVWPNLIWALHSHKIPVLLVNGTMPADSVMIKPFFRSFYYSIFSCFDFIAPASQADLNGFHQIVADRVEMQIQGDTRYDQVFFRAQETRQKKLLPESVFAGKLTIVAGSIWQSDEEHLFPAFVQLLQDIQNLFLILVPHEPTSEHTQQIKQYFAKTGYSSCLYSEEQLAQHLLAQRILIVDRIGILANLYGYGQIAYVGGSFGPGVHNVLEPAAFALPILFGPRILNSPEAQELVHRKAGFQVETWKDVQQILTTLCSEVDFRRAAGERALALVNENRGATARIAKRVVATISP